MSLVFSSSLVRLCSELMELSSLYSQYVPLHLHHLSNSNFSLELLLTDIVSLPERCNGCGLVLMQVSALCQAQCQLQGCRVLFSNVGEVPRLLDNINWGYMPRSSGAWAPMVTARDVCAPTFAYRRKDNFLVKVLLRTGSGCIAMTGCRKKLGSPGWFLDQPGGHC